jgi:5-methylthioadenosine/S-adenosylhomocysteine deaminase
MTERRILFRRGTIVTMDDHVPDLATGDLLVHGDRIEAIAPEIPATDAEVVDATGCIVLPGFIDSHHHSWMSLQRRLMPDLTDLFAFIDVVAEAIGSKYRPLDMYLSTKLTAVASLDSGITGIMDACHSSRSPEHTDAALDALRETGIRAQHMVGRPMDKQVDAAHLPGDLERLAGQWNRAGNLVQVGLFGHLALDLDRWRFARGLDMRVLYELVGGYNGLGPEFTEPGVLGPHTTFNHCTRIAERTWKVLADSGANVTVTPRSDVLFGFDNDGFAYQQAIDHAMKPALGIDVDTSYGNDMFGEMHALFLQQRAAMGYRRFRGEEDVPAAISVRAVLQAATTNGAYAVGLEDTIGTLTPGKQADLVMVRTDSVAVFPVSNAIAAVVQAVERSSVDTVMVAGAFRKRDGQLLGVDLANLRSEVEAARERLLEISGYSPDLFSTTV